MVHYSVLVASPANGFFALRHVLLVLSFTEKGSFAFEEFLELIGQKVKMKGFTKYRAQLDNRSE